MCFSASTRPGTCWTLSWPPWLERATVEHTGWGFTVYLSGLLFVKNPTSFNTADEFQKCIDLHHWRALGMICLRASFFLKIESAVLGNILEIKPNLSLFVVCVFIPSTFSCMSAIEICFPFKHNSDVVYRTMAINFHGWKNVIGVYLVQMWGLMSWECLFVYTPLL